MKKHLDFSEFTDPGEFRGIYESLPTDIEELCSLVRKQVVHYIEAQQEFGRLTQRQEQEYLKMFGYGSVRQIYKERQWKIFSLGCNKGECSIKN